MVPEESLSDPQNGRFEGLKRGFQVPYFDTLSIGKWLVIVKFSTDRGSECSYRVV